MENSGKKKRQQQPQMKQWRSLSAERDCGDYGTGGSSNNMPVVQPWTKKSLMRGRGGRRRPLVTLEVLVEVLRFLQLQTLVALSGRCSRFLFWASLRHPFLWRVHQSTPRIGRPLALSLANPHNQQQNQPQPNNNNNNRLGIRQQQQQQQPHQQQGINARPLCCKLFFRGPTPQQQQQQRDAADGANGHWEEAWRLPEQSLVSSLSGIESIRVCVSPFEVHQNNVAAFLQPLLDVLRVVVPLFLRAPSNSQRVLSFTVRNPFERLHPGRGTFYGPLMQGIIDALHQCLNQLQLQMESTLTLSTLSGGPTWFHHVVLNCDQPGQVVALFSAGGFLRSFTHRLTIVCNQPDIPALQEATNFMCWDYVAVEALAEWLESPQPTDEDAVAAGTDRVVVLTGQNGNAIDHQKSGESISLIITTLAMRAFSSPMDNENSDALTQDQTLQQQRQRQQPYAVLFPVKRSILSSCPQPFQRLDTAGRVKLTLSVHGPQPTFAPVDEAIEEQKPDCIEETSNPEKNAEHQGVNGTAAFGPKPMILLQPVDANPDLEAGRLQYQRHIVLFPQQQQPDNNGNGNESVWLVLRRELIPSITPEGIQGKPSPLGDNIFPPTLDRRYTKTLVGPAIHDLDRRHGQRPPPPRDDVRALEIHL